MQHHASQPLHQCTSAEQFAAAIHSCLGHSIVKALEHVVDPAAPMAMFLVGAHPLGTANSTSQLEIIVLVDTLSAVVASQISSTTYSDGYLTPARIDADPRAGSYCTSAGGMALNVTVVMTPTIVQVYKALRRKGPELNEAEIMTVGLLSSGWLLWESVDYLAFRGVRLSDPTFAVYCSTQHFTYALIFRRKATKVLELSDIPLVLYLSRTSVELAYLAYFCSEGQSYLGAMWLAQLGHARGAPERVENTPLLKQGLALLFPRHGSSMEQAEQHLREVSGFLNSMRGLIGRRRLFRIAFDACPQIFPL